MNYINKGKRDVLIFPKFENIEKLELIRKQYDELYGILPPHITLAFPFENDISDEDLEKYLSEIVKNIKPFKIKMKNISFHKDERVGKYYIFLDFVDGKDEIINLHNKIYQDVLNTTLNFEYIPHITLGSVDEIIDLNIDDEFETIVSELSVEQIGENEGSNIIIKTMIK